jgi:hypothetical protein
MTGVSWSMSGTGTGTGVLGGPVGGWFVIVIGTARLQWRVSNENSPSLKWSKLFGFA